MSRAKDKSEWKNRTKADFQQIKKQIKQQIKKQIQQQKNECMKHAGKSGSKMDRGRDVTVLGCSRLAQNQHIRSH